jgi:hypothetical protein
MKYKIYIFFILFSIFIKAKGNSDNIFDDELDLNLKYEESLRSYIKTYLIKHKLIESDRSIKKEEMKKIFIDIMEQGASEEEINDNMKYINEELANIFVNKYYKKRKEIKGKDIINLINVNDINQKYYQLIGEIPFFDEEDNDFISDSDL